MITALYLSILADIFAVCHYDLDPLNFFLLAVACVLVDSWDEIREERFERNCTTEQLADAYLQGAAHEAWRPLHDCPNCGERYGCRSIPCTHDCQEAPDEFYDWDHHDCEPDTVPQELIPATASENETRTEALLAPTPRGGGSFLDGGTTMKSRSLKARTGHA